MSCHKCVGRAARGRPVAARRAEPLRPGPGRHRAGQPGEPAGAARVAGDGPGPRRARRAAPLARRRPSASSICSWPAGRRRWRRSTTSRCSTQRNGEQLPDSVRQGQRLTGMSGNQSSLPLAGLAVRVRAARRATAPGSATCCRTPPKIVDDLCIVRSMFTEAINHDPAITFFQTGSQIAGRPSMGAWIHYGLGSDNEDLPAFVVLITPGKVDQPLYSRLWGSGFLPSQHQGVQFRSGKDAGALPRQSRTASRARAGGCCSIG